MIFPLPIGEPAARFTCPISPSVNNLYVNENGKLHGGRRKGPMYRDWLNTAGWEIKLQRPPFFTEPVAILVEVPREGKRDLDNYLKPLLDLLQKLCVIKNDNMVDDLRIVRCVAGDKMTISIWPLRIAADRAAE